eukprot:gene12144-14350_t
MFAVLRAGGPELHTTHHSGFLTGAVGASWLTIVEAEVSFWSYDPADLEAQLAAFQAWVVTDALLALQMDSFHGAREPPAALSQALIVTPASDGTRVRCQVSGESTAVLNGTLSAAYIDEGAVFDNLVLVGEPYTTHLLNFTVISAPPPPKTPFENQSSAVLAASGTDEK